ncbi:hypothetical protein Hypma_008467 [Hypsizygus marmoreus]|uniref:Protein kinase domain-containing protein n=1 Tax=Hypsizygus marmoreus TaxID=39966 RepID=A0A369K068_HYPMA|nr:hypothetical protein Hypma_008467 [Hypsizygus marmoreus]
MANETKLDAGAESKIAQLAFSSISIHGLVSDSAQNDIPITLSRSLSFPSNRTSFAPHRPFDGEEGWDSLPLPTQGLHLELALDERLGDGRIGLIYAAHVTRVLDHPGGVEIIDSVVNSTTQICVKLAKPLHCRSLAREAWFYERLPEEQGYQGVIVPKCYGLFSAAKNTLSATLGEELTIKPWGEGDVDAPLGYSEGSTEENTGDFLPDDWEKLGFMSDGRRSKVDSPWNKWRASPDAPLVCVLLMERLGNIYSEDFSECHPDSRMEIADLIDDLSSAAIMHRDFKFNNILRAPCASSQLCPRHRYAHGWRIIDFDRSTKWAKSVEVDTRRIPRYLREAFLDGTEFFWGSC